MLNNDIQNRKLIIHFHIFKNAGSTIDYIFKNNFGDSLKSVEGKYPWSIVRSNELVNFARSNESIKVITSHQAVFPIPEVRNLKIYPLFFLRHPIDRVGSVYYFEKRQMADSPGAIMAKKYNLKNYISWRLSEDGGNVIKNFQVLKLSDSLSNINDIRKILASKKEFEEAKTRLKQSKFFGIVEEFDSSILLMEEYLKMDFPRINYSYLKQNVSDARKNTLNERIADLRYQIGEEIFERLVDANQYDIELYNYSLDLFEDRVKCFNKNR